ncbi:MAG: hypothetical protein IT328_20055 [Caldilineaceae bacterium]|nr:hypothetical protein [Caldilineaceae bacterium]
MRSEPLWTTAIITAVIAALITLLKAFGVPLTADQQDAINQFVAVIAPIIVALVGRAYVTPVAEPKIKTESGRTVPLVRADSGLPPQVHP